MRVLLLITILYTVCGWASSDSWQSRWWGAQRIVDKHQFYQEEMLITEPANSIQSLFGIVYYSKEFKALKDCLFFEIPASGEMGRIFVVTTSVQKKCEEIEATSIKSDEIKAKSLTFKFSPNKLTLQFTDEKFRSKEIIFDFLNLAKNSPEIFQSSIMRKYGRSSIVLSQSSSVEKQPVPQGTMESDWHKKDLVNCQKVSDDCVKEESSCEQCRFGYFEVQNGCPAGGPKYCGIDQCGRKGQPACRRGFLYQNGEMLKMDCRTDTSFVFCQKGLKVRCQGSLALCD